ncbi:MAG: hypothetical protein DME46_00885 [Verrucomicrobia bacterium]|nr:MAG: hypothetical protein DME46_00885 [Verrucomicrobiota bacterium]
MWCRLANLCRSAILSPSSRKLWATRFRRISTPALIFGELTRQFVLRGADFFANVTNDGWFLRSAGSRQHLANAVFRCVENRRPMVRAANTGVTCFVNEFGRVTQILRDDQGSIFEEGTLIGDVNIAADPTLTFYAQHGELFAELCAAFALAILLIRMPTSLRRSR